MLNEPITAKIDKKSSCITVTIQTENMFYDITDTIQNILTIQDGFVVIYVPHTTCAIKIMENEKYLLGDMERFMERLVSRGQRYDHDDIERRDVPIHERLNAYSHLRSFFANTSETIPVKDGKLDMGEWQRIMFVEFDAGRTRGFRIYERSDT